MAKQIVQLNPKNSSAYNNMCNCYIRLKEYDKAIAACKNAVEREAELQLAKNNLGWAEELKAKQGE